MTSGRWHSEGLHRSSLLVGDLPREFLVYSPPACAPNCAAVLAFHGAGSSAEAMVDFCGMNLTAAQQGFVVVYPNGTGRTPTNRSWNADGANVYAARHKIDDVAFVDQLLDWLTEHVPHDAARVYATGMSNGALFCYTLARQLPQRLAGIAPVAVAMTALPNNDQIQSARWPMPVVHLHGTADHFVPYAGGRGHQSLTGTRFLPVEETVRYWAKRNGCDLTPEITELPIVIDDGTRVTRHRYRGGLAEVVLYQVAGGGHTWPGRACGYDFLGKVSGNLAANETIWDFFRTQVR